MIILYSYNYTAGEDILEFVHDSKNIIDADSDEGNEMNNTALIPQRRPKPHGPSAALFVKGRRHSKDHFGRLQRHLVSPYENKPSTALLENKQTQ
ncbi:hypothetical protein TNCV_3546841 [Trichonephila clavipes]|nr:hypothetical protein TNCV_3546841 [Trichonephila clavipes]